MIDTKEYSGRNDLSSLDVHKLIILVGAGVSIAPPTKLPSGKALTEYYLESCIGKELTNEILQRWKKLNDIIYKSNGFQNSLIRLEFIIGCINEIDIEFRYVPFIAGFQQFVNVNSNINHIYLGELLKRGCKIITPNFDCSIEKVFNSFCTTVRLGIPANDVKGGTIYHYHGIGTQYKQLGATISEIKKGLRKEFGNQLKEWFKQGYSIVSVGFSCSDYFDMTPFFESLAEDTYAGTAIFFQHGNVVEKEVENKIAKFYRGFKDRKIIYGDHIMQLFYEKERKQELEENNKKMLDKHYEMIEEKNRRYRKLEHDIYKHLNTLEVLSQGKDRDVISNYIMEIKEQIANLEETFILKNKVLQILVNGLYKKASNDNILCRFDIVDMDLTFLNSYDLTTLFGNLLDNAYEACLSVDEKQRFIYMHLYRFNNFIILCICNSYRKNENTNLFGSHIVFKESDKGIGLNNVTDVINKYNGQMEILRKQEEFEVRIVLPIS